MSELATCPYVSCDWRHWCSWADCVLVVDWLNRTSCPPNLSGVWCSTCCPGETQHSTLNKVHRQVSPPRRSSPADSRTTRACSVSPARFDAFVPLCVVSSLQRETCEEPHTTEVSAVCSLPARNGSKYSSSLVFKAAPPTTPSDKAHVSCLWRGGRWALSPLEVSCALCPARQCIHSSQLG